MLLLLLQVIPFSRPTTGNHRRHGGGGCRRQGWCLWMMISDDWYRMWTNSFRGRHGEDFPLWKTTRTRSPSTEAEAACLLLGSSSLLIIFPLSPSAPSSLHVSSGVVSVCVCVCIFCVGLSQEQQDGKGERMMFMMSIPIDDEEEEVNDVRPQGVEGGHREETAKKEGSKA